MNKIENKDVNNLLDFFEGAEPKEPITLVDLANIKFTTDDEHYEKLTNKIFKEDIINQAFKQIVPELKGVLKGLKSFKKSFEHIQFNLYGFLGPKFIIWTDGSILDSVYLAVWKSKHPDSRASKLRLLARIQDRKGIEYEFAIDKLDTILEEMDEEDLF